METGVDGLAASAAAASASELRRRRELGAADCWATAPATQTRTVKLKLGIAIRIVSSRTAPQAPWRPPSNGPFRRGSQATCRVLRINDLRDSGGTRLRQGERLARSL